MAHLLMCLLYFRDADDAVYDLNGSEFMGERWKKSFIKLYGGDLNTDILITEAFKPNISESGFRLEIRFRGEYQIVVTLVETNLDYNNIQIPDFYLMIWQILVIWILDQSIINFYTFYT